MKNIKEIGKIQLAVIVAVIVGAVAFFGGTKYGQYPPGGSNADLRNFQTRGTGMMGGLTGGQGRMTGGANRAGGFLAGEIIGQDDKSITVKLRDGGSRIVFVSSSTQVLKSINGSVSDLILGGQVTVTGGTNPDGSVTAQSVQIR